MQKIINKEQSLFDRFKVTGYFDNVTVATVNTSYERIMMLNFGGSIRRLAFKDRYNNRIEVVTDQGRNILHWREYNEYSEVLDVYLIGEKAVRVRNCKASFILKNFNTIDAMQIDGGERTSVIITGSEELKVYSDINDTIDSISNNWDKLGSKLSVELKDGSIFRCGVLRGTYYDYANTDYLLLKRTIYGAASGDKRESYRIIHRETLKNIHGIDKVEYIKYFGYGSEGFKGLWIIAERVKAFLNKYHLIDMENNGKVLLSTHYPIKSDKHNMITVEGMQKMTYNFNIETRELIKLD